MKRPTLRRRLTVLTTTVAAVAVIGLSIVVWVLLRFQLRGQIDQSLQSDASRAAARFNPARLASPPAWAEPDVAPLFGVVRPDGSRGWPRFQTLHLPVDAVDVAVAIGRSNDVLRDVYLGETHYRMLTVHSARGDAVQVARDLSDTDATLDRFAVLLCAADALVVGGTGGVGYALTRAGLRPVDRVRQAAEHVAMTQDLNAAVPITRSDPEEMASVAASVNAILTALGASRDAQRQLVEDAGHELATPMTSLRTNIDLLLRAERYPQRQLTAEDRTKLLIDIQAQTGELSNLMIEVVDLARDPGTAEEIVRIDLADVVRAAVIRARTRNPDVHYVLTAGSASIMARPAALQRAVVNLLDNAAKWTPPSGPVEVVVGRTGAYGDVIVSDRGPGIAAAELERVFERFYRSANARAMPGSGLGLAIVHQVVTALGGRTWIVRRDGGGTEAHIRLPTTVC
ncbi:MAG: sensor histidine kinase [Sciscionella sp.]